MTFRDIQSFVNIPQAWFYMCYEKELMFVNVDTIKFTEKSRVFIDENMSVMVRNKFMDFNVNCCGALY